MSSATRVVPDPSSAGAGRTGGLRKAVQLTNWLVRSRVRSRIFRAALARQLDVGRRDRTRRRRRRRTGGRARPGSGRSGTRCRAGTPRWPARTMARGIRRAAGRQPVAGGLALSAVDVQQQQAMGRTEDSGQLHTDLPPGRTTPIRDRRVNSRKPAQSDTPAAARASDRIGLPVTGRDPVAAERGSCGMRGPACGPPGAPMTSSLISRKGDEAAGRGGVARSRTGRRP